jgi:hypothetical protein
MMIFQSTRATRHMRSRETLVALILAVATLVGCSSGPMKPLEFKQPISLQEPLPGQALVYLIRAPHDSAEIEVEFNSAVAAVLPQLTFTAISLAPGEYLVQTKTRPSWSQPSPELGEPLRVTVSANQRRHFYLSQAKSTGIQATYGIGGAPFAAFTHIAVAVGPRSWKEADEREAQDLMSITAPKMPERSNPVPR